MGGQTDSDPSDITRAVYTNSVECFNGATGTWEELEDYKFPFMENGLESFAMVAVRATRCASVMALCLCAVCAFGV